MIHDQDLPICVTCGSQFESPDGEPPSRCKICDDPRQFVPPTGQSWTTLAKLRDGHANHWAQDETDPRIWWFWTEPKFAIGQRAFILVNADGNGGLVMWDMLAFLDASTIAKINSLGTLRAIVVSHPHYYTTWAMWSAVFGGVEVWIAEEDEQWICRPPPRDPIRISPNSDPAPAKLHLVKGGVGTQVDVVKGTTSGPKAVKVGGHFPGSLVLWWDRKLFIADSIVTVPSGHSPHPRPPNQTTYTFLWSIPNMIPMTPDDILGIWNALKGLDFDTSFGAFVGMDIRDEGLKGRLLQSMQTQVKTGGWRTHAILDEKA